MTNYYNPLDAKPGDFFTIDEPTGPLKHLMGHNFTIYEIAEWTRRVGVKHFVFTDYQLRDGELYVNVRVLPRENVEETDPKKYQAIVFQHDFEMSYEENFHKHVLLVSPILEQRDNNVITATYERLNGVQQPWASTVRVFKPKASEPDVEKIDYWDYGRDVEIDGKKLTEYYVVEMTKSDGYFHMYKGYDVNVASLLVLPR